MAGATVQWLRDGLRLFDNAADAELIAQATLDTRGVYLVPAFTGLGALIGIQRLGSYFWFNQRYRHSRDCDSWPRIGVLSNM